MEKIKGVIDRFEGEKAVIRYNGSEIIVEKGLVSSFTEGDVAIVTVSSEEEDKRDSSKVAKDLLTQVLKGE